MPKRKGIEQIVNDLYDDANVASAVLQSIKDNNTVDRILSGELVLPSEADATRFYRVKEGLDKYTEEQMADKQRIADLEKAVAALIDPKQPPNADYIRQLQERAAAFQKGA